MTCFWEVDRIKQGIMEAHVFPNQLHYYISNKANQTIDFFTVKKSEILIHVHFIKNGLFSQSIHKYFLNMTEIVCLALLVVILHKGTTGI